MNDPRIGLAVAHFNVIRDRLRANDITIDEQTLADTTEGLTDLHELLAQYVRGALHDRAHARALEIMIADQTARLGKFRERAEHRRAMVKDAMEQAHIKTLTMPDFTASLRASPPAVVLIDSVGPCCIIGSSQDHRPVAACARRATQSARPARARPSSPSGRRRVRIT